MLNIGKNLTSSEKTIGAVASQVSITPQRQESDEILIRMQTEAPIETTYNEASNKDLHGENVIFLTDSCYWNKP